jgi:uncharacterized alkaline shock family protein YloU
MSRDGHTVEGPHGRIRIEGDALARLVVAAVGQVEGARARRPRRGLGVAVEDGRVRVEVEVAARFGSVLPELARAVQESVAAALRGCAGLEVEQVDVTVEELDGA